MIEAEHHLTDTIRTVVTIATPVRPNVLNDIRDVRQDCLVYSISQPEMSVLLV